MANAEICSSIFILKGVQNNMKSKEKAEQPMKIEQISIEKLTPYENNPRQNDEAASRLKTSIKEFGFRVPLLIDANNVIVAGHTRYKAAKALGMDKLPCIRIEGLSDAQVKAFRIADNKYSEMSHWDTDLLKNELEVLKEMNFDIPSIGFDSSELSAILNIEEFMPDGDSLNDFDTSNDEKYVSFGEGLQYSPTGDEVCIKDCYDDERYKEFMSLIEKSELSNEMKSFLKLAASRFIVFNYKKIAELYCSKCSKDEQDVFEKLSLVIVDFNDALKNGLVRMSETLKTICEKDYHNDEL